MVILKKYEKICQIFEQNNGNNKVSLFAVLRMDEVIDKWSILISATWINEQNRKNIFGSFISILQKELSNEELSEIARIGFPNINDHLVQIFLEQFISGHHINEDAKINGNIIHEGYIVALNKSIQSEQLGLNT